MKGSLFKYPALCLATCLLFSASAQRIPGYNYEEAEIAPYHLLDPLLTDRGLPVATRKQWLARRSEILHLFEEDLYGRTPAGANIPLRCYLREINRDALDGLAIRKQVDIFFTDKGAAGPAMRLLLYLPVSRRRSPVVLGLNFGGNQTVLDDPAVEPTPVWTQPKGAATLNHKAPAAETRGSQADEWQVRMLLRRGYGLATVYHGDIEPDFKGASQKSIRQLFSSREQGAAAPDEWGALGAWAWGLSRALDYLQSDPDVDGGHVAVTGHSRLGKAADWAAAQDTRFAALLSTESGKAGQSLTRRGLGETVAHLEHSFPYWFCPAYAQWIGRDQQVPADGNLLLSLIAPRPLYVASAIGDEWSDPRGEFLAALSASRVYRLLGAGGLEDPTMPPVDQPTRKGRVAYHVRSGKHDVTAFDWANYLDFLDVSFHYTAPTRSREKP